MQTRERSPNKLAGEALRMLKTLNVPCRQSLTFVRPHSDGIYVLERPRIVWERNPQVSLEGQLEVAPGHRKRSLNCIIAS